MVEELVGVRFEDWRDGERPDWLEMGPSPLPLGRELFEDFRLEETRFLNREVMECRGR